MCPSLFQDLDKVDDRIRAAARISLFLDFDGTLVPLRPDPAEVRLSEETRETLVRLMRNDRTVTTMISGRSLSDLRDRIGLEGLIYAGNHGLEICGRQLHFVEPSAETRREELRELSAKLAAGLRDIQGAFVEYKGLTTSVHYRSAAVRELARIETLARSAVSSGPNSFRLDSGKMTFEIIPRTFWHKGAAARWINQHLGEGGALSIYLGDDNTDEDAFCALPNGITVKVGGFAATSAKYHLTDPSAVHEFLSWLVNHEPA